MCGPVSGLTSFTKATPNSNYGENYAFMKYFVI
jgi:hypothetical protein